MALLRVALVGCGIISESHVRAYKQFPDRARVTICCDIDPAKAAQRAAQVGDARVVTSYDDVLADPDVDAVEICTPHHLHRDAVIAAARAGKHILCQKPLGRTIEECDVMIDAAREAGVTLFYAEMMHTLPVVTIARDAIAAGRIGKMIGIHATYAQWQGGVYMSTAWRYNPALSGGGALLDGGIHYLSLVHNLGGPVESVMCFTTRFRPELGDEDTAALTLRFADGHLGSMFSTHAAGVWPPYPTMTVFGTEGMLAYGGPHGALTLHRADLPDGHEVMLKERGDPFVAMIGRYLDTVVDGADNPAPGEVGREDLRIVLAAYESAQTGKEVRIHPVPTAVPPLP
jgi:predicted dehydrogenase